MVVSSILPRERGGLLFGGNESTVIFFSNDQKVSLSRITQLFYQRVITVASAASKKPTPADSTAKENESDTNVESLLQECLSRLWILHCKDALQFKVSMAALPRRLETIATKNQAAKPSDVAATAAPSFPSVTLFVDTIDTYALLENKSAYQSDVVRSLQD